MSCLFNSLQYFIGENSYIIRQKICDYLEQNNQIMDGLETAAILETEGHDNYIQKMRNTNEWGGAIEIQAACNIWKYRIIVNNRRCKDLTNIEFLPVNNTYDKTIRLEWTGGHYEPVRDAEPTI